MKGRSKITLYPSGPRSGPSRRSRKRLGAVRPGHLQDVEPRVADGRGPVHGRAEGSPQHRREVRARHGILNNPASFYDFVDSATYDAWTPKGSIEVQASHDTFVYFSATRGFKSGGFNITAQGARQGLQPRVRLEL